MLLHGSCSRGAIFISLKSPWIGSMELLSLIRFSNLVLCWQPSLLQQCSDELGGGGETSAKLDTPLVFVPSFLAYQCCVEKMLHLSL